MSIMKKPTLPPLALEQPPAEHLTLEHITLDQLPTEVLVKVMQYLCVDDLFACRLVCKRLGILALDPYVWRHQQFTYQTSRPSRPSPCACAVLALAPCLGSLKYSYRMHTAGFFSTKCAVRKLNMLIVDRIHWAVIGLVLRNQEALGRLRHVHVRLSFISEGDLEDDEQFLKTLATCSGLESLVIENGLPVAMKPILRGPSRPSLKRFLCEVSETEAYFVNTVLTGHADTLEEVHISPTDFGLNSKGGRLSAVLAGPLARMPKLQSLKCEVFAGMEALAAPSVLKHVTLYLYDYDHSDSAARSAGRLLRRADQLRTIVLKSRDPDPNDVLVFLKALASSERPHVEHLYVNSVPEAGVDLLVSALPRLPALRQLFLSGQAVDNPLLLLTITPDTTPVLRSVTLCLKESNKWCSHAWLHREALKTVLTENPSLHVRVIAARCSTTCEVCALGCHPEGPRRSMWVYLFSHDPDSCPYPEDFNHVDGNMDTWTHIEKDA